MPLQQYKLRKSLPFNFRPNLGQPGSGLPASPPGAQPHPFFTPQTQRLRVPTVEEVAVPRDRFKTTGDMSRVWAYDIFTQTPAPADGSSPFTSFAHQDGQSSLATMIQSSQTPAKPNLETPPVTPSRRYTPKVTDFALPRYRRYRLSLHWMPPRPTDEENEQEEQEEQEEQDGQEGHDPRSRGSPCRETFSFSGDSRGSSRVSSCGRIGTRRPRGQRSKQRYTFGGMEEYLPGQQGRRYTNAV